MQPEQQTVCESGCVLSRLVLAHTHRFSHTHTDAHLMHIQTQSTDTQRDIYGGSRSSSPSVCAAILTPMIGLIKQIMTGYKQWRLCFCIMSASVGTKWKPLWCFHPQSGRIAPMLFRLYLPHPPLHPLPPSAPHSVWNQPNITRETLPLYHHSRKSTVTEYPEAPGWWLSAWPVWLGATLPDLSSV